MSLSKAQPLPEAQTDADGAKDTRPTEASPGLLQSRSPSAGAEGGQWTRICRIDDIPRLGARVIRQAEGPNIAVFRTSADQLFALADRCPHRGGPLSQGIVYGNRVACPLHNTNVELESGCAVAPDQGRVDRYAVKVETGIVYVDLRVSAERHAHG